MPVPDKLFDEVEIDSTSPSPCTPEEPDAAFRGILIQAPQRVVFGPNHRGPGGAFARIPICGTYMLPVPAEPTYDSVRAAMRLVAVDTESEEEYAAHMLDHDSSAPAPPCPPPTAEQLEGLASGGCFNPNLADYLPLPERPAVYRVHVELGDPEADDFVQSNVVTITLVEEQ